jgi:hypothetical protein
MRQHITANIAKTGTGIIATSFLFRALSWWIGLNSENQVFPYLQTVIAH